MKEDIKTKWVVALRSGEYKQGKYALKRNNGDYCCLGVLCMTLGEDFTNRPTPYGDEALSLINYKENSSLPVPLQEFTGLTSDIVNDLIALNDFNNYDFNEIADYIEQNL